MFSFLILESEGAVNYKRPLPSNKHHLSCCDYLEDKRGRLSELFSAVLCTTVVHTNAQFLQVY